MIDASHSVKPLYLTGGQLWETYDIIVENMSGESIAAEDVRFEIEAPDEINVYVDKAVELETGNWKPTRDLPPEVKVHFPINVGTERCGGLSKRELVVKIEVFGSVVGEDTQTLIY